MKILENHKRKKCRLCNSEKVNPVLNLPLVYVQINMEKYPLKKVLNTQ